MNKYLFSTLVVGILSIFISLLYLLNLWFSFDFLGVEQGSQTSFVNVWAIVNIVLAVLILLLSVNQIRRRQNRTMNYLLASINFILFINMLPLFMWSLMAFYDERIRGASLHLIVCVICFIAILGLLRGLRKEVLVLQK